MSDAEILQACLNREISAQEQLYRRFAPRMYGICLRYVRNRAEADDIMQEGFIKVFDNLANFRDEGSFEGWIKRIIVNTALNHYKQSDKYDYKDESEIPNCTVENAALSNIGTRELMKIINGLPDAYRMVFNLNVIEGYDHGEIGRLLGISEASSRVTLLRARISIQNKLTKHSKIYSHERSL